MGYRHYVGFMKKEDFEKIKQMTKEEFLKKYADYDEYDERYYFQGYDLREQGVLKEIECIGKLYYLRNNAIRNAIYESTETFPFFESEDNELFIIKSKDFFLKMAKGCWKQYISYLKNSSVEKIGNDEKIYLQLYKNFDNNFNFPKTGMLSNSYNWNFNTYNYLHLHKTFDYENNIIVVWAY